MVLKDEEKEEKWNHADNGKRKAEMMRRAAIERRKESMFTNKLNYLKPNVLINSKLDKHVFTLNFRGALSQVMVGSTWLPKANNLGGFL